MRRSFAALLVIGFCGCNIPVYTAKMEYYGNRRIIERELDRILPSDMATDGARAGLKKNGYEVELVAGKDHGTSDSWIIATKRTAHDTEDSRVSIPIKNGQIDRPFRIEWVDIETGVTVSSATTDSQ